MKSVMYTCPMHPEIISDIPGRCPKCGMQLVPRGVENETAGAQDENAAVSYKPLIIIITLIAFMTVIVGVEDIEAGVFVWKNVMTNFMSGFFLVFSGFKFLDVGGFAEGYSTYDLLAKRFPQYGYVYPFVELVFGIAYLIRAQLFTVNVLVFFIMGFSGIGVLDSMLKKRKIQCACLGTIIKVPLSSVTLVEDFGMALMALILLLV